MDKDGITEKLIIDPDDFSKILLNEIQNAKQEILVSTYIVDNDAFGTIVLQALKERAKAGVSIKFIVDGYGSSDWIGRGEAQSDQELFEIHIFHPLPWMLWKIKTKEGINLERIMHLISYINRRNHQKLFVFDRTKALLGSRNIHKQSIEWRENSLMVAGAVVDEIVEVFNSLWRRSHRKLIHRINKKPFESQKISQHVYSNHLLKLRHANQRRTFERLKNAKKSIQITTPYLFPTKKTLRLLYKKALSGVEISLLVPNEADVMMSKWISQFHYGLLIKAGVKIYEYQPSILHAKTAIIDDWALIGSSNFNRRSVYRDIELDYAVALPETVAALKEQFHRDVQVSKQVSKFDNMSIWKVVFAKIAIGLFPSWF